MLPHPAGEPAPGHARSGRSRRRFAIVEGVVVDGERDDTGAFYFDDHFVVFTTIDTQGGELIRCNGANCHVEIL